MLLGTLTMGSVANALQREPWNKDKIVGQKARSSQDIWALRVQLHMEHSVRELALFSLGLDRKLRGCDLVAVKVRNVCHGDQLATHWFSAGLSAPSHRRSDRNGLFGQCMEFVLGT